MRRGGLPSSRRRPAVWRTLNGRDAGGEGRSGGGGRGLRPLPRGVRIEEGPLRLHAARHIVSIAVRGALRVGVLLAEGIPVEGLASIVRADPLARVRGEALQSLLEDFCSDPRALEA